MTPIAAFLLGLIQGVTEFLPISSSAHLILIPYVLGWEEHSLRFEEVTNAGTLLAAMVYFRNDLSAAARGLLARRFAVSEEIGSSGQSRPGLIWAVLLASVPVLVVAVVFYEWFATVARQPVVIASTSIGFGLLLFWADRSAQRGRPLERLTWSDSAWIGVAQALALIPGTSRSGITLTAGLWRGVERSEAARFSMMLAIPVGMLALLKDLLELVQGQIPVTEMGPLAIGFVTSAISAYLVIGWLLKWLQNQRLTIFVVYRVVLGFGILALTQMR